MTIETNGQFWREVSEWRLAEQHNLDGRDCWRKPRVVEVLPTGASEYALLRDGAYMQWVQDDGATADPFNIGFDEGWREAVAHLQRVQGSRE